MESKSERKVKFEHWLCKILGQGQFEIVPMPGDASFRSYSRVLTQGKSYVAMDAPPPENCQSFVSIAAALRALSLNVPDIFASDLTNGFLLLSDFGDITYLNALNLDSASAQADALYLRALKALAVMQECREVPGHELKPFGREWMTREWDWHQEWFLEKWLGLSAVVNPALHSCYELLILAAESQPQVFMHRDYHAANLMVLPNNETGILDFQDAFIGPLTYDPVSLLRDCYIDWAEADIRRRALSYADMLRKQGLITQVTDDVFMRWFDWMGLQRHIKALMTFARKFVRDQQPRYLEFIPRTLNYVIQVSRHYPELRVLNEFYSGSVMQALKDNKILCEQ
ncbi:MAG TPA: phosphotransferase [Gammaproteobacteria bacterium]|jgi:aminoglycoside/choline kinase family phosphotransferase|nr:phosphotransferase [Gammaproteobacteria bacterium]